MLLHELGIAHNGAGNLADARRALEQVQAIAASQHLPVQGLRAAFELASVTSSDGRFDEAARLARDAVAGALAASNQGLAANGLIDLAEALSLARRSDDAEAHLQRATAITETTVSDAHVDAGAAGAGLDPHAAGARR